MKKEITEGRDHAGNTEVPPLEGTAHTKRRSRLWWIWGVLALLVVGIFLVVRRGKTTDKAQVADAVPVANIKVATVQRGDIGSYIEALGTVTPLATVNLYSQVTGIVTAVNYKEGQLVRRGDALIDIDPRPYDAQLKEAQGTLERDRAVLKQAEMDLARYQQASAQDAVARQTYEDQEQAVAQDRGTVNNDVGQVEYAQVQLSYCHLASPINGRVGLRLVDPGNTIFSGGTSPIVVVTQLQPITVVFDVAEDNLDQVRGEITHRKGLIVDAYDRSQQVKIASGKLLTLDNQIDTSTGTVRFRGEFDNEGLTLFPNQFVNARMLVKTLQNVLLVPNAAVQRNGTQAFVYVVNGDMVKVRNVNELVNESDQSAITGLNEGETVATTGFDKLQDGAKVHVQSQQASGTTAKQSAQAQQQSGAGL
jgi:multidrug efflux system membrane fusion protein